MIQNHAAIDRRCPLFWLVLLLPIVVCGCAAETQPSQTRSAEWSLSPPREGERLLRILTPNILELMVVTGAERNLDSAESGGGEPPLHFEASKAPAPNEFAVRVNNQIVPVWKAGYRRHALYAPLKPQARGTFARVRETLTPTIHRGALAPASSWDLRIGHFVYLVLTEPIPEGASVLVSSLSRNLISSGANFSSMADPLRWSPAIHVNQTGYLASHPRKAMVGHYLGTLGELDITGGSAGRMEAKEDSARIFRIIDSRDEREVFKGKLKLRPDRGFPDGSYQNVSEADFTLFSKPGEYRMQVPGLGVSYPFRISDDVAGAFARTYALGLYHQRCGAANELPFTRFTHKRCHTAPAAVPDDSGKFRSVTFTLEQETAEARKNPRHKAPRMQSVKSCLYPFVRRGPVNVSGGHHDAGDYSKYTLNSVALVHYLVFAVDNLPGVAALDNLGLPESGDGKSDVLQEAKWEADFLSRMQDDDGGFYFLVYPRDRRYENDVTPDKGDPQVVFPKTTAATAGATAALAQCASSPAFQKHFPDAAARYLEQAKKGWAFLERAIAKHGHDGAYQQITHYGGEFQHDDELAWAVCELYLATGEERFGEKLLEWLRPGDPATRRWGWWRLYEAWGCAIRSYAFAGQSGRMKPAHLDAALLRECQNEIVAAAHDQAERARTSAYGTSFPEETKRARSAGWYFSMDAAFDLAAACQLSFPEKNDPRPAFKEAVIANLNYEHGCNPVNMVFLTGLGSRRQHEIVHQYAQNDRRALPPSGIPLGNIQGGFSWVELYKDSVNKCAFPPYDTEGATYPFYDRWTDGFNLSQEFVIQNQARGLAVTAWLMAQTPLRDQRWQPVRAEINSGGGSSQTGPANSTPNERAFTLFAPGLNLEGSRIVWEAEDMEPFMGSKLIVPGGREPRWIEAEAELPDGRRVFAVR